MPEQLTYAYRFLLANAAECKREQLVKWTRSATWVPPARTGAQRKRRMKTRAVTHLRAENVSHPLRVRAGNYKSRRPYRAKQRLSDMVAPCWWAAIFLRLA